MSEIDTLSLDIDRTALAAVPHLDQWSGLWLMEPSRLSFLASLIAVTDIASHMRADGRVTTSMPGDYRSDQDGTATVRLAGTLQKHQSSMGTATSTVLARQAIRSAVADPAISKIMLSIESPGGTAAGTMELADEVANAAKIKPLHAHIEDLGASAAYWIASQASRVSANAMALVGSIGSYQVVEDLSASAEKAGVKIHVIRAGEFKGAGQPGTKITDEQLAYIQQLVDSRNELFIKAVATGRRVSEQTARQWADGKAYVASEAKKLGLIDAVESFEESFNRLQQGSQKMTTTASEILLKCPGAQKSFVDQCLAAELSITDVQTLYIGELRSQILTMSSQRDTVGIDPVSEPMASSQSSESAHDAYWSAVKAEESNGLSRQKAMSIVNRRNPELRQQLIDAVRQS